MYTNCAGPCPGGKEITIKVRTRPPAFITRERGLGIGAGVAKRTEVPRPGLSSGLAIEDDREAGGP